MSEPTTSIEAAHSSEPPSGHVRKSKRRFWIAGSIVMLLAISAITVILIQRWRRTPKIEMTLQIPGGDSARSIAFSPDGKIMAAVGYDTVWLWNARTGELLQTLKHKFEDGELGVTGTSLAFSPDSKTLAASYYRMVTLFDVQTGTQKLELRKKISDTIGTLAFSPDGKTLATGDPLRFWDAQTGELKQTLTEDNDRMRVVAFSPDGKKLAATVEEEDKATNDHIYYIKVWDTQTLELNLRLPVGEGSLDMPLAYSPDGKTLVSSDAHNRTRTWDAHTGELKRTIDASPKSLAFSPDGRMLALGFNWSTHGSGEDYIWLYDAQTWTLLQKFPYPLGHLVFSPDSKVLAGTGGIVREAESRKEYHTIRFLDVSGLK